MHGIGVIFAVISGFDRRKKHGFEPARGFVLMTLSAMHTHDAISRAGSAQRRRATDAARRFTASAARVRMATTSFLLLSSSPTTGDIVNAMRRPQFTLDSRCAGCYHSARVSRRLRLMARFTDLLGRYRGSGKIRVRPRHSRQPAAQHND